MLSWYLTLLRGCCRCFCGGFWCRSCSCWWRGGFCGSCCLLQLDCWGVKHGHLQPVSFSLFLGKINEIGLMNIYLTIGPADLVAEHSQKYFAEFRHTCCANFGCFLRFGALLGCLFRLIFPGNFFWCQGLHRLESTNVTRLYYKNQNAPIFGVSRGGLFGCGSL